MILRVGCATEQPNEVEQQWATHRDPILEEAKTRKDFLGAAMHASAGRYLLIQRVVVFFPQILETLTIQGIWNLKIQFMSMFMSDFIIDITVEHYTNERYRGVHVENLPMRINGHQF